MWPHLIYLVFLLAIPRVLARSASQTIKKIKVLGFGHKEIEETSEDDNRSLHKSGLTPSMKQIYGLETEYPAQTNYLYVTYQGVEYHFQEGSRAVDIYAVADKGNMIAYAVASHIEDTGVHSGYATLVPPAHNLEDHEKHAIADIGLKSAQGLDISGPYNAQILITPDGRMKVIECNVRGNRSLPFVSKTTEIDFIGLATKIFLGEPYEVPEKRKIDEGGGIPGVLLPTKSKSAHNSPSKKSKIRMPLRVDDDGYKNIPDILDKTVFTLTRDDWMKLGFSMDQANQLIKEFHPKKIQFYEVNSHVYIESTFRDVLHRLYEGPPDLDTHSCGRANSGNDGVHARKFYGPDEGTDGYSEFMIAHFPLTAELPQAKDLLTNDMFLNIPSTKVDVFQPQWQQQLVITLS